MSRWWCQAEINDDELLRFDWSARFSLFAEDLEVVFCFPLFNSTSRIPTEIRLGEQ